MNAPTIIIGLLVLAVFAAIVGRAVYNRRHHRGGCGCGCGECPSRGMCHPER